MDVRLPVGTTYIIVVDTDSYAGNFERQMTGYITGTFDAERSHGRTEAEDARAVNPQITDSLRKKSRSVQHEEYGYVSNTIRRTPGRLNNGMGQYFDATEGENGYPAYESVAIFFHKQPSPEEMEFVKARAAEYAAGPVGPFYGKTTIGIKDIYLVEATVTAPVERRLD